MQQSGTILQDLAQWKFEISPTSRVEQGLKIQVLPISQQRIAFGAIMYHAFRLPRSMLSTLIEKYVQHQPNDPYCVELCHIMIRNLHLSIPIVPSATISGQPSVSCFAPPTAVNENQRPTNHRRRKPSSDENEPAKKKSKPSPLPELLQERANQLQAELKQIISTQERTTHAIIGSTVELMLDAIGHHASHASTVYTLLQLETQPDDVILAIFMYAHP